jgi:hypothetical protein
MYKVIWFNFFSLLLLLESLNFKDYLFRLHLCKTNCIPILFSILNCLFTNDLRKKRETWHKKSLSK